MNETVDIDYDKICIFRSSDTAYCVIFDESDRDINGPKVTFLPKSQCEANENEKTITVPTSLAEKKGLV